MLMCTHMHTQLTGQVKHFQVHDRMALVGITPSIAIGMCDFIQFQAWTAASKMVYSTSEKLFSVAAIVGTIFKSGVLLLVT